VRYDALIMFEITAITRTRIRSAYAVALLTDALQILLGPLGWTFADEVLDLIAMIVISWLIGFHALLLPTFVLELVPIADLLPTWTGAVALVLALRRRSHAETSSPATTGDRKVIDV
jgi:hypothetical protein